MLAERGAKVVPGARELWLFFVALLVSPGCLTHLIVLRFADALLEHLCTLAPSLGILEPSSYETGRGVRA